MSDGRAEKPHRWLALGALVLGGLSARLTNLDSGLAHDEIATLVQYVRLPVGQLLTSCTEFNNHMFFSLLAHGSIAIFGESAWALRLPAVIFGVACIPVLWWLASLVVGRVWAVFVAILLMVSPHHIAFSTSARGYTGLLFFGFVGTGLFIQGMRRPALRTWLAFAAVNAAALWTHLTAAYALVGQALIWAVLAVRARRSPARAAALPGAASFHPLLGCVLAGAIGLTLYAPLIPKLAQSFGAHVGAASEFTKVRPWTNPLWTLRELLEGMGSSPLAIAAVVIGSLVAGTGFVSLLRRDPVAVLAMVVFAPIALAVFWGFGFHIWPRYFFALLGPGLIFVVRGLEVIARMVWPARAGVLAGVGCILIGAAFYAVTIQQGHLPKQDYPGAVGLVAANRFPGEPVLTAGIAAFDCVRYYAPDWTEIATPADLDREVAKARSAGSRPSQRRRVWFIYTFPTALEDSNPGVLDHVKSGFEVVMEFPGTIRDGTVVVCRDKFLK